MFSQSEFAKALGFTLLVGGARADADAGQLAALQALIPLLKELIKAGDYAEASAQVHRVMGPTWLPSEEWTLRNE